MPWNTPANRDETERPASRRKCLPAVSRPLVPANVNAFHCLTVPIRYGSDSVPEPGTQAEKLKSGTILCPAMFSTVAATGGTVPSSLNGLRMETVPL